MVCCIIIANVSLGTIILMPPLLVNTSNKMLSFTHHLSWGAVVFTVYEHSLIAIQKMECHIMETTATVHVHVCAVSQLFFKQTLPSDQKSFRQMLDHECEKAHQCLGLRRRKLINILYSKIINRLYNCTCVQMNVKRHTTATLPVCTVHL